MKRELNPIVAVVVIAIVVIAAGAWLWSRAQGTTFTKASARGIQFTPKNATSR